MLRLVLPLMVVRRNVAIIVLVLRLLSCDLLLICVTPFGGLSDGLKGAMGEKSG